MARATTRRRPAEDDEEELNERPRRRRVADDDEQEEKPRRRRRDPEPDDEEEEEYDEPPRSRRRVTEDRPTRRKADDRSTKRSSRRVASGWGGYQKVKANTGDFETKFKPTSEAQIIALLEPEPFACFARHWVDLDEGKRAVMCLGSLDEPEDGDEDVPGCPLCDVGDKANGAKAYLNVAVLKPRGKPSHEVWEIGPKISEMLEMIDKSIGKRTKLTDIYLEVSSKGSGLNTRYFVEPVFEEDLVDYDVKPLTDSQRDGFELYDDSLYPVPTERELNKVADEIA